MVKHTEWDVSHIDNSHEGENRRVTPACFERARVKLEAEQLLIWMVESTKKAEARRLIRILKS